MQRGLKLILFSHSFFPIIQRGCVQTWLHGHRGHAWLQMGFHQASAEDPAGIFSLLHPRRPHHQTRQLLAKTEDQLRQLQVWVWGTVTFQSLTCRVVLLEVDVLMSLELCCSSLHIHFFFFFWMFWLFYAIIRLFCLPGWCIISSVKISAFGCRHKINFERNKG